MFGSVARGDASATSDIDLLADFAHRKSLLDLVRIEREFTKQLGRQVDLLTERALSPYLRTPPYANPLPEAIDAAQWWLIISQ